MGRLRTLGNDAPEGSNKPKKSILYVCPFARYSDLAFERLRRRGKFPGCKAFIGTRKELGGHLSLYHTVPGVQAAILQQLVNCEAPEGWKAPEVTW